MPGKVNPVIPEAVNQVAFEVIGNDLSLTLATEGRQLQLNVMEPLIAYKIFDPIRLLIRAKDGEHCVVSITPSTWPTARPKLNARAASQTGAELFSDSLTDRY